VNPLSKIPFVSLEYQNKLIHNEFIVGIEKILGSNSFLLGNYLKEFESSYASYLGVKNVIGVANGTDALEISLRSLGLDKNSLVCIPAFTFAATGIAVLRAGFRLMFSDIDPQTGNISVARLKELRQKPDVIIGVSLFGRSLDFELLTWCDSNRIKLVEDSAQSHGSSKGLAWEAVHPEVCATSFYPTKNLGCFGDGGAVIVNNEQLVENITRLRNYGGIKKYEHRQYGFNSRLSEIQALALLLKVKHLDKWNMERINLASHYYKLLLEVEEVELPKVDFDGTNVFHLFPILYSKRDDLRTFLQINGVETGIHYPEPLHEMGIFKDIYVKNTTLLNAENWAKRNLTLPIYPGLDFKAIDRVVKLIKEFIFKI
jgi:dTDP-4-amino-4,6-dideoxygalactose transaminase